MRSDFMAKLSAPSPSRRHLAFAGAALIAASTLAGCVVEQPRPAERVVVRPAPPPPRAEMQPPPPSERAVWDPGHWNWNGRDYAWVSGHYIERPNVAMRWEPGHWAQERGNWVWAEGGWH
jgi:hypothetical protein